MKYAATILVFVAMPLAAHPSTAAEYDVTKIVTLQGVVTKVDWLNPHGRIYLDVKDVAGSIVHWEVELRSPNRLIREGWTRSTINAGDFIGIDGSPAKEGGHLANARSVTLADGRVMPCDPCRAMWARPLPRK